MTAVGRTVIAAASDFSTLDRSSGVLRVAGRRAQLRYRELWRGCYAAYCHRLGPLPLDYSGRNNHGTRDVGVLDNPMGWQFDGTTNAVLMLPLTTKLLSTAQTLTLSFSTVLSGATDKFLFACDQTASGGWGSDPRRLLYYNNGTETVYQDGNPGDTLITNTTDRHDGQTHQLALTFDGVSTTTMYINGVQVGSDETSSFEAGPFVRVTIGGVNGDTLSRFWSGEIDDIRFYSRSLSRREINLLAHKFKAPYECILL